MRPTPTPSGAFTPYAPPPTTPEMRTTPNSMIGSATITFRRGRSPHRNQAASATITTWRLPIIVASPAPMLSTT